MKVGTAMPVAESANGGQPRYGEIRALARQAEAVGLDSIWVFDHLLYRFPDKPPAGIWEAWTVLTALAEATERVELGALVMCTAFRNPALLAKMADTLDEVSDGRLILGLGAGWHEPEFDAFDFPFDRRVGRFEEAIQIIAPLLKTGRVDFRGEFHRAENCELRPRGPRPEGPPILVGTGGPRMLRILARHADAWNTCWLGQPTAYPERLQALGAACAEVGRALSTVEQTVGVAIAFPDLGPSDPADDRGADRVVRGGVDEVADVLGQYAALGVGHVIMWCDPNTPEAIDRLGEAVDRFRAGQSA